MRHGYWLAATGTAHGDPVYAVLAEVEGRKLFGAEAKWDRFDGVSIVDGRVILLARNYFSERPEICREENIKKYEERIEHMRRRLEVLQTESG